jgi:DNA polymerase-3 subunit beta
VEFTISKTAFFQNLHAAVNVVTPKITFPIISNVLLDASGGTLQLTATDIDNTISISDDVSVKSEGKITVPGRRLFEIVRELDEGDVFVKVEEKKILITCGNSFFSIMGMGAEDFPERSEEAWDFTLELPAVKVKRYINKTMFSVSTDDTKKPLNGLLVEIDGEHLRFVASNTITFSRMEVEGSFSVEDMKQLVIPLKSVQIVSRLIPDTEEAVTISGSKKYIEYGWGNKRLVSRLLDDSYPNYRKVIPSNNDKVIVINTQELLKSVRRISVIASQHTHQIVCHLRKGMLKLTVNTPDVGEGEEMIDVKYDGEDMDIGFNAYYLLDVLKATDFEESIFSFYSPTTAGIVIPSQQQTGEDYLNLIMPIRLYE